MSEAGQRVAPTANVRKLETVVREMRNVAAEREDVVVEMREASRTRLELLAQELEPVFAQVPEDEPMFDFAISSGEQPRLWIDSVAHVSMGRDRRTYRFLRDTRLGRVVLAESAEIAPVADQVTRYIAERLVERERAIAGELEILPRGREVVSRTPAGAKRRGGWEAFFSGLGLVFLGSVVGIATIMLILHERFPELNRLF